MSLDLLCIAGYDGYFKDVNPAWSELLGYSREEILQLPYLSLVHPDDRTTTLADAQRLVIEGRTLTFENRYRRKDGAYRWLLWQAVAVPDRQLIYAIAREMTAQKRREGRLAAQYAVTRVLSEASTLVDAAPCILQAIGESVGWELGAMWQVHRDAKLLRCLRTWPTSPPMFPEFERITSVMTFPPGIGLPGRVWSSASPAWIEDILHDKNFPRLPFAASSGLHGAFAFPIHDGGEVSGVVEFFSREIQRVDDELLKIVVAIGLQIGQFIARKQVEGERERLIGQLREALANVKTLSGLLPICSSCKKIRDDKGYWNRLEDYILAHSQAHITHGICADCARKMHPDWDEVK